MRIRSAAFAGLWLFAAACGGTEESRSTARTQEPSRGGEMATSRTTMPSQEAGVSTGARTPMGQTGVSAGATGTGMGAGASVGGTGVGAGAGVSGTGISGEMGGSGSLAQGGASGSAGATGRDLGPGAGMGASEMEMEGEMGMEEGMQGGMQHEGGTQHEGSMAQRPEQRGMEREPLAQSTQNEVCPADLEGLNVRVTQIPRGGALVLTASGEDVSELRARLHRLASMHYQHEGSSRQRSQSSMQQGSMQRSQGSTQEGRPSGGGAARAPTGEEVGAQGEAMGSHEQMSSHFADENALIHQASEIRVIEIPRGARLEVRFDDATKVRDLRSELRETANMLSNGQCPLSLQIEES